MIDLGLIFCIDWVRLCRRFIFVFILWFRGREFFLINFWGGWFFFFFRVILVDIYFVFIIIFVFRGFIFFLFVRSVFLVIWIFFVIMDILFFFRELLCLEMFLFEELLVVIVILFLDFIFVFLEFVFDVWLVVDIEFKFFFRFWLVCLEEVIFWLDSFLRLEFFFVCSMFLFWLVFFIFFKL